jgi:hypothetical protein
MRLKCTVVNIKILCYEFRYETIALCDRFSSQP